MDSKIKQSTRAVSTTKKPFHKVNGFQDEDFQNFCENPDYRRALLRENILQFSNYASKVYPDSYLKRINELTNINPDENEKRALETILKLPVCAQVNLDRNKIAKNLVEIFKGNNSMQSVCEAIIGYMAELTKLCNQSKFGRITLREIETNAKRLPRLNFLLVGEKGTGKSWIGMAIAEILNLPHINVDCANTDHLALIGTASQWGGSSEGLLARRLIGERRFPLIVTLDEVDKTGHANHVNLIDVINHIVDPLKVFQDEFLQVPLYHYSLSVFILTANNLSVLPDYLTSRCVIYYVKPVSSEQRLKIAMDKIIKSTVHEKILYLEINKLMHDNDFKRKLIEIIETNNLDIRAIKQRLEVAMMRYNFYLNFENKNCKLKDILLDEFENLYDKSMSKNSDKKVKLGFL